MDSLSQQDEREDYFNQNIAACHELTAQIAATDAEIDDKVLTYTG